MSKRRKRRGNVFQRPGRHGWYYRFVLAGKVIEKRGGETRDEAQASLYAHRLEKRAARRNGSIGPVPFAVAVKQYLAAIDGKEAKNYAEHKRHTLDRLVARWGSLALAAIRPEDVTAYQSERIQRVNGATVNRELSYVSAVYTWAARTRLLDFGYNPASKKMGVVWFTETKSAARPVPDALLKRLLAKMPTEWRRWILLLLNLGVRKGVVYKMNWRDVDWDAGYVSWESKGGSGRIRMNETVRALLERIGPKVEGRIYDYKTDTVLWRHWTRAQDEVSKELGIELRPVDPKTGKRRGIRLHDLRATFGTELSAKGTPLRDIQQMMGHRDVKTTERYVVPSQDRQDQAVGHLHDPGALELELAEKAKEKPQTL